MRVVVAFILISAASATSSFGIQGKITNGMVAFEGQFPYMVNLAVHLAEGKFYCGGALISINWILTAAHCFRNAGNGNIIHIYLGLTNVNDVEIGYALWSNDAVRAHPAWNPKSGQNDIALIQIPATQPCTKIQAVRMPPLNTPVSQNYDGQYGIASGWGLMAGELGYPDRLQWGRMKIVQNKFCRQYPKFNTNTELCIDTSVDFISCCIGDSGGPFILESTGELVGVVSRSFGESCEAGYPNIITKITPYLQWIKKNTGISY